MTSCDDSRSANSSTRSQNNGRLSIGNIKPLFTRAHLLAPPGAPPAAPALRSQRRPLDGGGWPRGLVLGDGQPAWLGLLGLGGWSCSGGGTASGSAHRRYAKTLEE